MIIFIHGTDTFRSRQYLKKLKDKFLADVDKTGDSLSVVDGITCDIDEIKSAMQGASLFARKRMVIVEDLFLNKKDTIFGQVFEFVKDKDPESTEDNIIIFWDSLGEKERITKAKKDLHNYLIKTKFSPKPFAKLSNLEITSWITNEFATRGAQIDQQAAILLTSIAEDDLWKINSEIEKIYHHKAAQSKQGETITITKQDVEQMVTGKVSDNIFALIDAIANKNKPAAVKFLHDQLEFGSNDLQILSLVSRQYKILARVKEQSELGVNNAHQIASTLKIHPFVAQKSLAQVKGYTLFDIKNILKNLIEIDYKFKTGKANVRSELEMMIVKS